MLLRVLLMEPARGTSTMGHPSSFVGVSPMERCESTSSLVASRSY